MGEALVVRGLCRSFGAVCAADGVSLTVEAGQVHALIGPNGAGKTTVFNCISGFLRPDAGEVRLEGRDVTGWPPHRLVFSGLARTFQITKVFGELAVLENVALAVRSRQGRNLDVWHRAGAVGQAQAEAAEILELLELTERADLRAEQLGHGDKRVLEVAIALALRPRVLLLDEPTAGMSAGESDRIAQLIRRIAERTSVLLVEHDTEMVLAIADAITVMTQGRVIAQGTPDAISRDARVQDAYLGAVDAART
ncbi:MAG TPA: ABC transporter ATP-binding protein [Methylomirabilota bacterium]|nr:ABC transporter ATP-binding protein [Methylomirabilota bacterium]